jgi:hypothetical protein
LYLPAEERNPLEKAFAEADSLALQYIESWGSDDQDAKASIKGKFADVVRDVKFDQVTGELRLKAAQLAFTGSQYKIAADLFFGIRPHY